MIRLAGAAVILLLAVSLGTAAAQTAAPVFRIGYLNPGSADDPIRQRRLEAFRQGLRDVGYVEGQNVVIEARWADGKFDRYPVLATELVRANVDVIVAVSGAAAQAVRQATTTVPIVMSFAADPIASGLVSSLARPGGNITGISLVAADLVDKQLELLTQAVPRASRVAALRNPDNSAGVAELREVVAAAQVLKVQLQTFEARTPQEIDRAFAAIARYRAGAVLILADALFNDQRRRVAALAARQRLPSMFSQPEYVEAGGLMFYGPNPLTLERRSANYVDRILKGAKPADLPVEQPTTFELIINQRTAKAIGLTIPPSLLQRADHIID